MTCPSYGRVGEDGAPADPASDDYDRAARDALAFAALFDRFIQNLRRYLGYDTPGRSLRPLTRITWTMRGGCCTPSPTVSDSRPHSLRHADGQQAASTVSTFRQSRHENGGDVTELLTIEGVAERLRVSVETVRWLRQQGRFVPAIKVGRRLVWDARDVDAWLKAQRETKVA